MSLARTLMNGGIMEPSIDSARYGHSMGATRIAMESVEELHEIFMESFYETEQIELAAATEGVEVAGSKFEAMLEATNKSVLQRVKDFLAKLWEKVKAFFHNVKRFIASIVMSGKDFAKKYKADIDKIKGLKDFEFEMYKYNDEKIDNPDEISDVEKEADSIVDQILTEVDNISKMADIPEKEEDINNIVKKVKDLFNEKWEDDQRGVAVEKPGLVAAEDFDEELFKFFRNGATDAQDKEKRELSDSEVKDFAKTMADSKAEAKLNTLQAKTDKVYKKAQKAVSDMETNIKKSDDLKNRSKVASAISTVCSEMSSAISKLQSIDNKKIAAWKSAYRERDAAYKACIMAAFTHARKQK